MGAWQKCGHISPTGGGVAIDLLTGYVVDFEVLFKYLHCIAFGIIIIIM